MLQVHCSNRPERLEARLLDRLARPPAAASGLAAAFARDTVVVPSAALRQSLTLALARRQGVSSQLDFDYLARWLWQQLARVLPGEVDAESPLAAEPLAWRVHAAFGDVAFVAPHARLRRYLAAADPVQRLDLARRVAAQVETMATFRPDWLAQWQRDPSARVTDGHPDEAWQAALWRRLAADLGLSDTPPLQRMSAALERDGAPGAIARGLPAQVHVFMPPSIPPLHVDWLRRLARVIDVDLYLLNPCREYWFDLVDPRRLAWLESRGRAAGHEVGQPLLARWGRQTQALFDTLLTADEPIDLDDDFEPLGGGSLLHRLHNAVLTLDALAPGSLAPRRAGDRSVELHVCHSLTRELEVLHERLLGLFADDPALQPSDVLVALPDLGAAAPLIDAVFGSVPAARRIAYRITGLPPSRIDAPARALLELLALAASRAPASAVFALLQQPIVARRFGLDDDDLARVHGWFESSGMRWGFDAGHRADAGLPPTAAHTLAQGLERLMLGYALPGSDADGGFGDDAPGAVGVAAAAGFGLLPAGDAEGAAADALGEVWRFVDAAATLRRDAAHPRPMTEWAAWLQARIDQFLAPSDDELPALVDLRAGVQALAATVARHAPDERLPLAVLRDALQAQLDEPARGGVAGGSVTFAALPSLRGMPFAVIALLGLDDGVFPSPARAPEFDLLATAPRRGDRQRRLDDRNLLLDLVLAARHTLHLSHSGRSVRDNSPRPASVPVVELIEWLVAATADGSPDGAAAARARLVVEHPLQAFAPIGFDPAADPRLRSHADEVAAALRAAAGPAPAGDVDLVGTDDGDEPIDPHALVVAPEAPLFARPLPPLDAADFTLDLSDLVAFFRNPCRALLRRRLGITLPEPADALSDDEPFVVDRRAQHRLRERLLPAALDGVDDDTLGALARAGVDLPAGTVGRATWSAAQAELRRFAERLRDARDASGGTAPTEAHSLAITVDGDTWRLRAELAPQADGSLLRWRAARLRANDLLAAWIWHLWRHARAAAGPAPAGAGAPGATRFIALDATRTLAPTPDAGERLAELLRLYAQGQREPLRFYPQSAWVCCVDGAAAARREWTPTERRPASEGADPAYRLALRGLGDPLDEPFESIARGVFEPLVRHLA